MSLNYDMSLFLTNLTSAEERPVKESNIATLIELVIEQGKWSSDLIAQFSQEEIEEAISMLDYYDAACPDRTCLLARLVASEKSKDNLKYLRTKQTARSSNFF